jgi:hypothetical protein
MILGHHRIWQVPYLRASPWDLDDRSRRAQGRKLRRRASPDCGLCLWFQESVRRARERAFASQICVRAYHPVCIVSNIGTTWPGITHRGASEVGCIRRNPPHMCLGKLQKGAHAQFECWHPFADCIIPIGSETWSTIRTAMELQTVFKELAAAEDKGLSEEQRKELEEKAAAKGMLALFKVRRFSLSHRVCGFFLRLKTTDTDSGG